MLQIWTIHYFSFSHTEHLFQHQLPTLDIEKIKLFLWCKVSIWYIIHYQPTYKMLGFMHYFAHGIFTDAHQYYLRMQYTVTDLFGKSTR